MTTRILEMNVKNVGDLQDAVLNVVFSIELTIEFEAPFSPKYSSIIAPDQICPIGFAIP